MGMNPQYGSPTRRSHKQPRTILQEVTEDTEKTKDGEENLPVPSVSSCKSEGLEINAIKLTTDRTD